ncbi:MAG: shikimate dehydrogenase family protein [Flavobacteriales bacterium]
MRTFGLIGNPLTHSFSKKYFEEKFVQLGIADARYELFELSSLEDYNQLITDKISAGLNVTIPFKEKIIPFLDEVDDEANAIGAVNCIQFKKGKSKGYNTDVYGFEMSVKPFLENKYERALILGTGGASKAVAHVLKKWNIPFHFATRNPVKENHLDYGALSAENIHFFPLIINTTPLGTFPDIDQCPEIPFSSLNANHFLIDLIYNPAESLFLQKGKKAGAQIMNGKRMLELQADKSWEIWNSVD